MKDNKDLVILFVLVFVLGLFFGYLLRLKCQDKAAKITEVETIQCWMRRGCWLRGSGSICVPFLDRVPFVW